MIPAAEAAPPSMNWYCVHTKPAREAKAAAHLANTLGLQTYFPRLKQQRTIRRVRRLVTTPLFPRYLFCRFDLSTGYRSVRYALDVIDVVSFGGKPAVVGEGIIAQLKGWAGETTGAIAFQPELTAGDLVKISDGPLRGLEAVVLQARSDRDRVAVLLWMLEYGAKITINRSQLARL